MKTILLVLLVLLEESLQNMRCYTSVDMSHRASVQCGRGYSCLKVVQQPQVFDVYGQFVPEEKRRTGEVVYRGCFVLDIHKDICYIATSGLEYCWCSSKDLCNPATRNHLHSWMNFLMVLLILINYLK